MSPSIEAAVINAKYINVVPFYRQEQEFGRYVLHISRQNMANWTIQCTDRYLAILNGYLHEKMYSYHMLQADETRVLVNKDGRPAGAKSFIWVLYTGIIILIVNMVISISLTQLLVSKVILYITSPHL